MTGFFAIDTNVAVYALSEGPKADIAAQLLEAGPSVSVQLLNEFANVSVRKRKLPWPEVEESLSIINTLAVSLRPVDLDVHKYGCDIARRYKLGIHDSMIIAAALLDDCDTLFTEDMQHGMVIDAKLTITNPFLSTDMP